MPARSEYLGIRLTPQERAALERAAKATQLSTSALVRLALRELLNGERVEVRILGTLDAHTRIPQP